MMSSMNKDYVFQMQMDRYEIFTSQDFENGNFDVKFVIQEKIVHAHKFMLMPVSETMNSWLSERWTKKDEPIKIDTYSFNCFYQFLCFIYIGDCELSIENITEMIDLAEFYAVPLFKELCDKFLATKYPISPQNIEKMYDFGQTYSLPFFTESIKKFIHEKGDRIIRENNFLSFTKPFVQFFSDCVTSGERFKQECFEAVYKWVKHQIMENASAENDESVDIQEAIKTELYTIIPHPDFCKMKEQFLMDFVVQIGFCLSPVQMCQVFQSFDQYTNEQYKFKFMYDLAQKQGSRITLDGATLAYYTKAMLKEVIPHVKFCYMDKQFLMDFVVENGFHLSPTEFRQISYLHEYIQPFENEQQKFKYFYELAEKQALKKQSIATKNGVSFNVTDSINADLAEVMLRLKFHEMDKEFLIDSVFENGIFLSPTELCQLFNFVTLNKRQKFKYVYELAEKQALKKQSVAAKNGENFNIADSIKTDMAEILQKNKDLEILNFLSDNPICAIVLTGFLFFLFCCILFF